MGKTRNHKLPRVVGKDDVGDQQARKSRVPRGGAPPPHSEKLATREGRGKKRKVG